MTETDQPIPASAITDLYILQLEHQLAMARVAQLQMAAQQLEAQFNARGTSLAQQYGVVLDEWTFDMKAGTMTKKAP